MTRIPSLPTELPRALGYHWPAEWEPHAATWLAWPRKAESWPGIFERIPAAYARLVQAIARFEPVHILAAEETAWAQTRELLETCSNVHVYRIPTDDSWIRDFGPLFLRSLHGTCDAIADFRYNAWGGKYPPWQNDDQATAVITEAVGARRFATSIVLEGGSIEGDGQGTVMTTSRCLLDPRRNPGVTRDQAERWFADYLGATRVLWVDYGELEGDDTDGHIDQLVRFANPQTLLAAVAQDSSDPNHEPLSEMQAQLRTFSDRHGRPYEIVALPIPRRASFEDQRLPASYCNFYLVNGGVIMPTFDEPEDDKARQILAQVFPDREVQPVPCRDLVWGLGAVHCLTQQQPR